MENSTRPELMSCARSLPGRHLFTAWFTVYLLLLPVFLLVLYIGFNKWKKPQSSASGSLSHSDVFTLNMVAMEMTNITGSIAVCHGYYWVNDDVSLFGKNVIAAAMTGQMLFHTLTCVERYLAVVHPVTYLRLRGEGGVTVRNISIALVWVFSVVYTSLLRLVQNDLFVTVWGFVPTFVPLVFIIYCSVYILRVLTRPKPGKRGGPRKQIDQSKRSTVYTIAAILTVLMMRFIVDIVSYSVYILRLHKVVECVITILSIWPALPSSLVLPLLFLQRAGKLIGCK